MRNYKIDNIKGILIFLVVFGHLLKISLVNKNIFYIYILIYIFHMPVFILTTGYFAKINKSKIKNLIIPLYLIFQTVYFIIDKFFLNKSITILDYLLRPHWIMWYLFSYILYIISIPILNKMKNRKIILVISIILSVLAGYLPFDDTFALSRTIVFFPFFIFGYYLKNHEDEYLKWFEYIYKYKYLILITTIIFYFVFINYCNNITDFYWIYERSPYKNLIGNMHVLNRSIHLMFGFLMTIILYVFIPNLKIKNISFLGTKTLFIFLLHGVFIKILDKFKITYYLYIFLQDYIVKNSILLTLMYIVLLIITSIVIIKISLIMAESIKIFKRRRKS